MSSKENAQEEEDEENEILYCNFCSKKAVFHCGNCYAVAYCSLDHQKNDRPSHKIHCKSPQDKFKELKKQSTSYRKQFFQKMRKGNFYEAESICGTMKNLDKEIANLFHSPMNEIEYGASVCSHTRILMTLSNPNEAQEAINSYIREKKSFLESTDEIPSKIKLEDPKYEQVKRFVEGKIKLLATINSLIHQLIRSSIQILQILLLHCEKFYGYYSVEVSNIYFQIAAYYNNLSQYKKAIACYWISGKIRKKKGAASFYNMAVIFFKQKQWKKALEYFNKSLQLIEENSTHSTSLGQTYIAIGICYLKLNQKLSVCIEYFERALCFYTFYDNSHVNYDLCQQILKILQIFLRKEYDDDQAITLPKELEQKAKPILISNKNYDDYWNLDRNEDESRKIQEWKESFKRQNEKIKFQSQIPLTNKLVEKTLFTNNFLENKEEKMFAISSSEFQLRVNYSFIEQLNSQQVSYLHQLNRILAENRDKTIVYDIVENSNLFQCLDPHMIQRLYDLNPEIKKLQYPSKDKDSGKVNKK